MLKVYGASVSPFVRKVLLAHSSSKSCLTTRSWLVQACFRRTGTRSARSETMPVLEHDGFLLPDSSVICRYLDEVFPARSIYPAESRAPWPGVLV